MNHARGESQHMVSAIEIAAAALASPTSKANVESARRYTLQCLSFAFGHTVEPERAALWASFAPVAGRHTPPLSPASSSKPTMPSPSAVSPLSASTPRVRRQRWRHRSPPHAPPSFAASAHTAAATSPSFRSLSCCPGCLSLYLCRPRKEGVEGGERGRGWHLFSCDTQ